MAGEKVARHPSSARFHELLKEIGDLHDKKSRDYGTTDDPFANVRASQEWGIAPHLGALVRLNDKIVRLKTYAKTGVLANEGVDDSLRDIAVYALIALVMFEEGAKPPLHQTALSNGGGNGVDAFAKEP